MLGISRRSLRGLEDSTGDGGDEAQDHPWRRNRSNHGEAMMVIDSMGSYESTATNHGESARQ